MKFKNPAIMIYKVVIIFSYDDLNHEPLNKTQGNNLFEISDTVAQRHTRYLKFP